MSFATRGMRQGSCKSQSMSQQDKANAFSNCNIIDYKQGLNFGQPVAASMLPVVAGDIESRYSLNLDKNGHTVDMHISAARPVETNSENHAVTPVSVASMSDMVAKVSREMVQRTAAPNTKIQAKNTKQIANLKSEISDMRAELEYSQRIPQAGKARRVQEKDDGLTNTSSAHSGLVHHTGVLQRQQQSIEKLDTQMQNLQQDNARLDVRMQKEFRGVQSDRHNFDAGLKHHTHAMTEMKTTIQEMDAGLNNHTTVLRALKSTAKVNKHDDADVLKELQSEMRSLRSQMAASQAVPAVRAKAQPVRSAPVLATSCRVAATPGTDRLAALMAKYESGR